MKVDEINASVVGVIKSWPLLYTYLSRPVFENLGLEGEKAIRRGLRAWARYRGERLRKWNIEQGLPLNLKSAARTWFHNPTRGGTTDSQTQREQDPELAHTPYYVRIKPTVCVINEVCKNENFEHYGYIFCDETHQEAIKTYHPKAIVEIHENLMKGDDFCGFTWMMITETPEEEIDWSGYDAFEKRQNENLVEAALHFLKWDVKDMGALYYYLADALIQRFGEEGKRIATAALIEVGRKRGKELKMKLNEAGLKRTFANIWSHFDLPYKHLWRMNVEISDDARSDQFTADVVLPVS